MDCLYRGPVLASLAVVWPAAAWAAVDVRAPVSAGLPASPVVHAEVIDGQVQEIQAGLDAGAVDSEDLSARVAALFGQIPDGGGLRTRPVRLRGWYKPRIFAGASKDESREQNSVLGLAEATREGLRESEEASAEVVEAYLHGEQMRERGLAGYDQDGQLGGGQLGVYVYTPEQALAIRYNDRMREVQEYAGNEWAVATKIHEDAHARDHIKGELNPIQVRKGEVLAYKTEYLWLQMIDPTGEKLSWARATIGKFAPASSKAPPFVGQYLEHLAMIRDYGDRGDFPGLVAALGYQDGSGGSFAEHLHGAGCSHH